MPCFSVAVELGQPAARALHVEKDDAFAEAMKGDVAAILRNRRPHPGFEQFLDGADNGLVGVIIKLAAVGHGQGLYRPSAWAALDR